MGYSKPRTYIAFQCISSCFYFREFLIKTLNLAISPGFCWMDNTIPFSANRTATFHKIRISNLECFITNRMIHCHGSFTIFINAQNLYFLSVFLCNSALNTCKLFTVRTSVMLHKPCSRAFKFLPALIAEEPDRFSGIYIRTQHLNLWILLFTADTGSAIWF